MKFKSNAKYNEEPKNRERFRFEIQFFSNRYPQIRWLRRYTVSKL